MLFDTSVLDRVKKRLHENNTDELNSDTQVIPDFGSSILFGGDETQTIDSGTDEPKMPETTQAIRLPQLALDLSEFQKPTQLIETATRPSPMASESTQIIPRPPHGKLLDTDGESTPRDVDKKTQSATLAAELTRVSLTDEENELNEDADTTRDSSIQRTVTTRAELERIEQDLNEQKRLRNIQPEFKRKAHDPRKQLLDAFASDSEPGEGINSESGLHSSPITSPMKAKDTRTNANDEVASDSEFEIDVLGLLSAENKKPPQKKKLSPIEEYAEKLKKQMNSSPTKSQQDMIALDDSDSGEEFDQEHRFEIPKLTKEQIFTLRQKLSRKNFARTTVTNSKFHNQASLQQGNSLFNDLRRANAKQIQDLKKSNPDSELLEEIEKEEEEMGNLLEREMERVRRIRKKEKLLEKAQRALLAERSDDDYDDARQNSDASHDSDVPDSEVDSYASDSDNDSGEELASKPMPTFRQNRTKRGRRFVLSDDDEEENPILETRSSQKPGTPEPQFASGDERIDDSYMFGRQATEGESYDSDGPVMQIHSDMTRPESSVVASPIGETSSPRNDSDKLFANLPPPTAKQESSVIEPAEASHHGHVSFHENISTQKSDEMSFVATQVDGSSLRATSTQDDRIIPTQKDSVSDDEDDVHAAINMGRRQIRENAKLSLSQGGLEPAESDGEKESEDIEEATEEELKQRLAMYEDRIRRKELKARKLRKEMERKGMKGIVEGEAEESDDEWKGIGGKDREDSDQADSEDEKMIDNDFNIDLNDEEVRKKFMEQYQIKDRNELEKLMDDIKNHRLTKRSRANRFDIELSDEEDEILMAYRRQKLEEQKQRLQENQQSMHTSKSAKTKAFFDCIQEEPVIPILIDSETSDDELDASDSISSKVKEVASEQSDVEEKPKKKRVLEESFVQKQLSFLIKTEEDSYAANQKASDIQHGVDDDAEDVSVLKRRCLSSLYSRSGSTEEFAVSRQEAQVEVLTDEDDDVVSHVFKKPSMVSSFKTHRDKHAAQVSTHSFSGVTVNKHYKVASASKASITYMSKHSKMKQATPSLLKSSKARELEERVDKAKLENRNLYNRDNFT